ncbi:MAG: hypothetical protein H6815_11525 [Phycisphaeraceae bacterium]|nr:hypothetical protein [Phycisphaerales bacterium]MCB9861068.1 hypothetical protein [Phycisphaeraceae bacterium]
MQFKVTGKNPKGELTSMTLEAVDELEALLDALHKHDISEATAEVVETSLIALSPANTQQPPSSSPAADLAFGMVDKWANEKKQTNTLAEPALVDVPKSSAVIEDLQRQIDSAYTTIRQLRDQVRALELHQESAPSYIRSIAKEEAAKGKWTRRIILLVAFLGVLALSPSMPEVMQNIQTFIENATGQRVDLGENTP